jgi:hypothetical protein
MTYNASVMREDRFIFEMAKGAALRHLRLPDVPASTSSDFVRFHDQRREIQAIILFMWHNDKTYESCKRSMSVKKLCWRGPSPSLRSGSLTIVASRVGSQ